VDDDADDDGPTWSSTVTRNMMMKVVEWGE